MRSKFLGFDKGDDSSKPNRFTGVPAAFFTELLPQVSNLTELKVTLHLFFLAGQKRGEPKWVGYWELEQAEELLQGLKRPGDPRPPQELLREGLEMALARGTILRLLVAPAPPEIGAFGGELEPVEPAKATWFLLNTAANRAFIKRLEQGDIQLEDTTLLEGLDIWDWPLHRQPTTSTAKNTRSATTQEIREWQEKRRLRVQSQRPDIYTLYEQNIGPLTPILSERLREAAETYPPQWVEEAFTEAVSYNRRSWAYIARILENWSVEGKALPGSPPVRSNNRGGTPGRNADYGQESSRRHEGESTASAGRGNLGRTGERGGDLASDGAGTPAAQQSPPIRDGSRRPAAPHRPRRPIDFDKYTTGKYAYLTQPLPARPEGNPGSDPDE